MTSKKESERRPAKAAAKSKPAKAPKKSTTDKEESGVHRKLVESSKLG